jgi:hypothetical protein
MTYTSVRRISARSATALASCVWHGESSVERADAQGVLNPARRTKPTASPPVRTVQRPPSARPKPPPNPVFRTKLLAAPITYTVSCSRCGTTAAGRPSQAASTLVNERPHNAPTRNGTCLGCWPPAAGVGRWSSGSGISTSIRCRFVLASSECPVARSSLSQIAYGRCEDWCRMAWSPPATLAS